MVLNKRGQGLSLNVIIVAALALVVLVVLILIFTGRLALFTGDLEKQGNAELITLQTQYGDCHPGVIAETTFRTEFNRAESPSEEAAARSVLTDELNRCKGLVDRTGCESADCAWK